MPGTVHHGDALAVLADLATDSVDAVITDPPYSSGGRSVVDRKRSTSTKYVTGHTAELPDFLGDQRDQRSWGYWCTLWLAECLRVTVPGGSVLMTCDWRQYPTASDAVQAAGWTWRGVVVWAKPSGRCRPIRGGFRAQAEYVIWGTNGPLRRDHEVYLPGVIAASSDANREHPTQKPLGLLRQLVQVAPPGGMVLDPFAGAGTTGAAAIAEGRRFAGVELIDHYAAVARRRVDHAESAPPLAL